MSRTLTAADRSALIRLASTLPAGSAERRAILAGLSKQAMAFRFPQFPIKGVGDKLTVMGTFEAGTEPSKYGEPQGRKVRLTPDTPEGYVLDVIKGYKSNPSSAMIDQMGGGAWANDEPDQYLVNFGGMKVYVTQDDWDAKKIMAVPPAKEWASSLLKASQDDIIEQLRVLNGGRHLDLLPHQLEKVWDKKHGRGAWANLLVTNLTKNLPIGKRDLRFIQDQALKMIRTSSSDRSALIRLASALPAGSAERRAILAGLSKKASGGIDLRNPPRSVFKPGDASIHAGELTHPRFRTDAVRSALFHLDKYQEAEEFSQDEMGRHWAISAAKNKWLVLAWAQVAEEEGISLPPSVKAFVRQHANDKF